MRKRPLWMDTINKRTFYTWVGLLKYNIMILVANYKLSLAQTFKMNEREHFPIVLVSGGTNFSFFRKWPFALSRLLSLAKICLFLSFGMKNNLEN